MLNVTSDAVCPMCWGPIQPDLEISEEAVLYAETAEALGLDPLAAA